MRNVLILLCIFLSGARILSLVIHLQQHPNIRRKISGLNRSTFIRSSQITELTTFNSAEIAKIQGDCSFLCRRVDFDLAHVGVPAILMVGDYCNLHHKSSQWIVVDVLDWNYYPSTWLGQFDYFNFL